MIVSSKTYKNLIRLFQALSPKRKRSLLTLIPIAILAGITDVLVIGLISRLFTIASGQANTPSLPFPELIPQEPSTKILLLVIAYCLMNWFASFVKLILRGRTINIKAALRCELAELAHRNILYQPYEYFITRKTSDISSTILIVIERVSNLIVEPILRSICAIIVIVFIAITVLTLEKIIALYLIISMVIIYVVTIALITPFLRYASKQRIVLEEETNNILS